MRRVPGIYDHWIVALPTCLVLLLAAWFMLGILGIPPVGRIALFVILFANAGYLIQRHRWTQPASISLRGHCQRCGYDLTDDRIGTCPKCGTPVPGRVAHQAASKGGLVFPGLAKLWFFPDLARFGDKNEMNEAWCKAFRPAWVAMYLAAWFLAMTAGPVLVRGLRSALPLDAVPSALDAVFYVLIWIAVGFLFLILVRRRIERSLWKQLAARGEPVCAGCGYNLTGNVTGVCSECGGPVTLGGARHT